MYIYLKVLRGAGRTAGTCDMNLKKLNNGIHNWNADSVNEFLGKCIERFGSMNKNDYEVALFHLLMKNEFYQESDFTISTKLQIPESKVKRLRYEMNLVYEVSETDLDGMLAEKLKNGDFKFSGERIQFCINDKILRLYLNNKLLNDNRFADSSFNSNIVSVTPDDLAHLIESIKFNEKDKKNLINIIKDKLKKSLKEFSPSVCERIAKVVNPLLCTIGGAALESVVNNSIDEIKNFYKK